MSRLSEDQAAEKGEAARDPYQWTGLDRERFADEMAARDEQQRDREF